MMLWGSLRILGTISFVVICIAITTMVIAMFGMFAVCIIKVLFY